MNRLRLSIVLIFICVCSFGQNLVLNPSFEQFTTCPNYVSQLNRATGWTSSYYSPDYYNTCSTIVGIPLNSGGFQYPSTGNAYAGGSCFGAGSNTYSYPDLREWLTGTLTQPLSIGVRYYVSFKVVLGNYSSFAVNKLGARFVTSAGLLSFKNNADVYTTATISDTLNWTKVSGTFVADSNYTYISIGNHFPDSLTDTVRIKPINHSFYAYYYFDDVCVSTDSSYCQSFITAIRTNQMNKIRVFPNPFTTEIKIEMGDQRSYEFYLYDVFSRQILQESFTEVMTVNITSITNGVYFYEIRNQTGVAERGKVLKE